jgi:hypothetical protein
MSLSTGSSSANLSRNSSSEVISESIELIYESAGVKNGNELKELVSRRQETNDQLKRELKTMDKLASASRTNVKTVAHLSDT